MDRVTNLCFAKTAGPSTALRSGRDDKGKVVTFRKISDLDGQSYEPPLWESEGPSTALRSGRDDNLLQDQRLFPRIYSGLYRIIIPTEAQRSGGTCGFSPAHLIWTTLLLTFPALSVGAHPVLAVVGG
jgi:hypothetical protein